MTWFRFPSGELCDAEAFREFKKARLRIIGVAYDGGCVDLYMAADTEEADAILDNIAMAVGCYQ